MLKSAVAGIADGKAIGAAAGRQRQRKTAVSVGNGTIRGTGPKNAGCCQGLPLRGNHGTPQLRLAPQGYPWPQYQKYPNQKEFIFHEYKSTHHQVLSKEKVFFHNDYLCRHLLTFLSDEIPASRAGLINGLHKYRNIPARWVGSIAGNKRKNHWLAPTIAKSLSFSRSGIIFSLHEKKLRKSLQVSY